MASLACFCDQSLGPVWIELPCTYMLFPGRVLTCCSFTELCHFVAVAHPLAQEFTFPPELSANMFRDPEVRQLAQAFAIHPGPRQGGVNCVYVPGIIQVLESMGIVAQCFHLAYRLHYICPLCGVSYPGDLCVC